MPCLCNDMKQDMILLSKNIMMEPDLAFLWDELYNSADLFRLISYE